MLENRLLLLSIKAYKVTGSWSLSYPVYQAFIIILYNQADTSDNPHCYPDF